MNSLYFNKPGGVENLLVGERPTPEPGPGQVRIRVKACSLNHLDLWILKGLTAYGTKYPHISGCDVAGIIDKVGEEVSGWSEGQKVIVSPGLSCFKCKSCLQGFDNLCEKFTVLGAGSDGGFAEFVLVPAVNLITYPENVSYEEAAAYPLTFLTAWHMLVTRARLEKGESVLILGAGSGVGVAAIQIAKYLGARVLAATGTDEKCARARGLGADETVNYNNEDFSRIAHKWSDGIGVNVVFEHIGPETWEKSIKSLSKKGRLVTCGATSGPQVKLDLRYMFSRELSVFGSIMGTKKELQEVTDLVSQGKLKPIVDKIFSINQAQEAYQRMQSRQNFGKIILNP